MIHCFPVVSDHPELHLHQGNVLLVELGAHDRIVRYSALPLNYLVILPLLVAQGVITSSLSADDLASLASGVEPPGAAVCLAPSEDRRHEERRQTHLRLVASE